MEKKTRKRRSTIPEEIWALLPDEPHLADARLNKTAIEGLYQAYTAIDHYDPVTKKKSEKRTYFGKIKNGKFYYLPGYLLKLREEELERLKAQQAATVDEESTDQLEETKQSVNNSPIESKVTIEEKASGEINEVKAVTIDEGAEKVLKIARTIKDDRQKSKVVYQVDHVMLVSLLSALGGATSCVAIADYWRDNRNFLERTIPDFPKRDISHDTVRKLLMICNPERLEVLFRQMVQPLISLVAWRTVAVDGQAVRASGTPKHPHYIMNFYDTENGVAIGQRLVGEKTNETTVAPAMIEDLDLRGAVVTCDALNTRCDFARDLLLAGADYCMAVKRNWKKLLRGMMACFETANKEEIRTLTETNTGHGRIETRTIKVLPAKKLSKKLLERWFGLSEGCIVMTTTEIVDKSTGKTSSQDRYFVTSLRFENPRITEQCATSIRRHWGIENELHYVLDVNFYQDRTQCKNANYLMNRVRLNQLAHALINRIRQNDLDSNGKPKSRKRVMASMSSPERALEQLAKVYRN